MSFNLKNGYLKFNLKKVNIDATLQDYRRFFSTLPLFIFSMLNTFEIKFFEILVFEAASYSRHFFVFNFFFLP